MQAVVGGNVRYPNLQSVADLFRVRINDTFNNAGGSGTGYGGGAGVIMPNSNPDLTTFMDSAIQELFSDLRNVGDPELVLDNYILTGLPPLNSSSGLGVANPATQVSIAYQGYFDGVDWWSDFPLPISVSKVLALWERQTGINEDFIPVTPVPGGLPGVLQGIRQKYYEMRQGQIWMPGSTGQTDIRVRARIGYPTSFDAMNMNFDVTYIPIVDCRNAVVAKMLVQYAVRFAPLLYETAMAEEERYGSKLRLESVRAMQQFENQRSAFGDEAVADFALAWSWL